MFTTTQRYSHHDKRSKLPGWIAEFITDSHVNLSVEIAMAFARDFLREMSQPWSKEEQLGHSLLTEADLKRKSAEQSAIGISSSGGGGAASSSSAPVMDVDAEAEARIQEEMSAAADLMDVDA